MRSRLIVLAMLSMPAIAGAQTPAVSGVRDSAGMFGAGAVRQATDALRGVRDKTGWQVVVETIDSLRGREIKDAAVANAQRLRVHGLYALFAKQEKRFYIEPSESAKTAFGKEKLDAIKSAITSAFKSGKFDQGLISAVALIEKAAVSAPDPRLVRTDTAESRGPAAPGVRDGARMFSLLETRDADAALRNLAERTPVRCVIETVDSLRGRTAAEVALANANKLQVRGLYVLIAKQDRKVYVQPSDSMRNMFTKANEGRVIAAVTQAFAKGDNDRGLRDAIKVIEEISGRAGNIVARAPTPVPAPARNPSVPAVPSLTGEAPSAPVEGKVEPRLDNTPSPRVEPPARTSPPPVRTQTQARRSGGGFLPILFFLAAIVVGFLLLRAMFRKLAAAGRASASSPPSQAADSPLEGGPLSGGWATTPSAPGHAPAPAPPPGGGVFGSALGGLGGAVAGNILYDHLGRPVHTETHIIHHHQSTSGFGVDRPATPPRPDIAPERYDPAAGAGGSWSEPAQSQPDEWSGSTGGIASVGSGVSGTPVGEQPSSGAEGSWSDPQTADGGDWSGSTDDQLANERSEGESGVESSADWSGESATEEVADSGGDAGSGWSGDAADGQEQNWG